jgi:hypothetical protein
MRAIPVRKVSALREDFHHGVMNKAVGRQGLWDINPVCPAGEIGNTPSRLGHK